MFGNNYFLHRNFTKLIFVKKKFETQPKTSKEIVLFLKRNAGQKKNMAGLKFLQVKIWKLSLRYSSFWFVFRFKFRAIAASFVWNVSSSKYYHHLERSWGIIQKWSILVFNGQKTERVQFVCIVWLNMGEGVKLTFF